MIMNWRKKNKYSRWYDALMEKARQRTDLEWPFEKHHVWPIALGGPRKGETVALTFKEHFLAHWLLIKFAANKIGRMKMRFALSAMCWVNGQNQNREFIIIPSWRYVLAKKAMLEGCKDRHRWSEQEKEEIGERAKDWWANGPLEIKQERNKKISASMMGNQYSLGGPGFKGPHKEDTKKAQSAGSAKYWEQVKAGIIPAPDHSNRSEETKKAQSLGAKKYWGQVQAGLIPAPDHSTGLKKHWKRIQDGLAFTSNAKLTLDQVREIRKLKDILPQTAIAEKFNVTPPTINAILRGKSWKGVI
jgi:hypothetical protein